MPTRSRRFKDSVYEQIARVMAAEAVEVLREKGFEAHRMEQGVAEWRARGWRVDAVPGDAGATTRAGRRP